MTENERQQLIALVQQFTDKRVLVIGDVILDEYIVGRARRMSREAPIPVLEQTERRYIAGGAANPAMTLRALGADTRLVGVVGDDPQQASLQSCLQDSHVDAHLLSDDARSTLVKTRILATMGLRFPQQVARIDTISRTEITSELEAKILQQGQSVKSGEAILLSDYLCGLLTPGLVRSIIAYGQQHKVLVAVDAQGELDKYAGATLVKCNADEASAYLLTDLRTHADFEQAVQTIYGKLGLSGAMVITRGAEGAIVYDGQSMTHCPSPDVQDVFDTVGAGDTAIAVMTVARLAGATFVQAVMLANFASGIVVQHVGNYAPTPQELVEAIND
ncbi:MAG: ribokinase [Anaerolineaceae bacterium]|nr:ribokinase [Anaerolineaceae bacterium]